MARWTTAEMASQAGRAAIITGGTGGLGYATALALAGAGARVVIAGRNVAKGRDAVGRILAAYPAAAVSFEAMDQASLAAVAAFAEKMALATPRLDMLINNAGVMAIPTRQLTKDGFETQFGVNYLSHYALTGHLLPLLRQSTAPRVVNLSSVAHRRGRLAFDDLQGARSYRAWGAYAQSKLAMLMFSRELQRRSEAAGWGLRSVGAHPGWAATDIQTGGPAMTASGQLSLFIRLIDTLAPFVAQSAAQGALPTLFAATAPGARAGAYYGPDGPGELYGYPSPAKLAPQATDDAAASRLWAVSQELTGMRIE